MSHFTVLVIGDNPTEQLQPFHEYECTGTEDQYVVFVPVTEEDLAEAKGEYEEDKSNYANFDDFINENYGWQKEDDQYGRRTNPNAKWDWYLLGGRWTGYFKLKPGVRGVSGEPGLMTRAAQPGYADSVLKKHIDFEAMRKAAVDKATERFDTAMAVLKDLPVHKTYKELLAENNEDYDIARNAYWAQPRCEVWNRKLKDVFGMMSSPDDFVTDREAYLKEASDGAISTFAIIKDGKWYERGEMGWWGIVSDEKDKDEWDAQFAAMIDALPEETPLHVYDCHI